MKSIVSKYYYKVLFIDKSYPTKPKPKVDKWKKEDKVVKDGKEKR